MNMEQCFHESNMELIEKSRGGDKEAFEKLTENNFGLVSAVSKKFLHKDYDYNDIFQTGCIGLVKAIKNFNEDFNVKFSTYAVPLIAGEIRRFIRDDGMVKVSRNLKSTARKISREKEKLLNELEREPTFEELSDYSGVEMNDMVFAMESCFGVQYLFDTVHQNDGVPVLLIDKICENSRYDVEIVEHMALMEAIDSLESKLRNIIILRYFMDKTQSQVAKILGISQVQVSRMEKKGLKIMKEKLS